MAEIALESVLPELSHEIAEEPSPEQTPESPSSTPGVTSQEPAASTPPSAQQSAPAAPLSPPPEDGVRTEVQRLAQQLAEDRAARQQLTQAVAAMYQNQMQGAQQQQRPQAPPVAQNPEQLIDQPERIQEGIQQSAEWAVQQSLQQIGQGMQPYVQRLSQLEQQNAAHVAASQSRALSDAARLVEERHGFRDFTDFRGEIESDLRNAGPEGQAMLADPEQLVKAYILKRVDRGLPLREEPTAVPKATVSPSGNAPSSNDQRLPSEYGPMLKEVWSTLAKSDNSVFQNLPKKLTPEEVDVLRRAAWSPTAAPGEMPR